ncbi:MAG: hypothetical protein IJU05_01375 [Schwartzia sp.]|nr:hypothetical protein [Schwartzia sp. (in: firmicutes)]
MSVAEAEVSATGANKFLVRGFANRQKLMNHWKNGRTHQGEFPEIKTVDEYERKAIELLEMPVGGDIIGHADGHGNVIRYNKAKNEFAKGKPSQGAKTYMRPTNGIQYYLEMLKGDMEHGGRR